jgi:hypothetical protein
MRIMCQWSLVLSTNAHVFDLLGVADAGNGAVNIRDPTGTWWVGGSIE